MERIVEILIFDVKLEIILLFEFYLSIWISVIKYYWIIIGVNVYLFI